MPSQRTVALSLDEETLEIWKALPAGERSQRVREALVMAEIVLNRDLSISKRDHEIKQLKKERDDLKLYMSEYRSLRE
tara:strand:- start:152 stop:385 length:234 start_codon:yes stop_codon:yes gene_type:complete